MFRSSLAVVIWKYRYTLDAPAEREDDFVQIVIVGDVGD